MSTEDVATAFGEPSFVRQEQPAEVWQYRQAGCIVDMFLYTDGAEGPYRVEHMEMRGPEQNISLSENDQQDCFADLAGVG